MLPVLVGKGKYRHNWVKIILRSSSTLSISAKNPHFFLMKKCGFHFVSNRVEIIASRAILKKQECFPPAAPAFPGSVRGDCAKTGYIIF